MKLGALTGMPRQIFDNIWSALRWSHQVKDRPSGLSHSEHCWMLIDDMVDIFNQHREETFVPSEWICVDKSISQWYELGGQWINIVLRMYVTIDRKPESGCEIPNSACDSPQTQSSRLSSVLVLRATKKQKTGTGGKPTKFCAQGQCRVCVKA